MAYLACWVLCAAAGCTAWRIVRRLFPWAGFADAIVRVGVVVFAMVAAAGLILGSIGVIGLSSYLGLFVAAFAASQFIARPRDPVAWRLPAPPIALAAILIPLIACIVAVGLVRSPLTLYDALSYHLVFPARWLQDGRISIVPTPFSDPAQAYQPANGELFFLWLMLPFHGDLLARVGQLPFLLLAGAALYRLARRSGAAPVHALYAPFFFCLLRPVVEQAVGADVDLICAALFLTSLELGIAATDTTSDRRDWLLWGASLGLYIGSKYLALVYLPVLLLPMVWRRRWRPLVWSVPGIAMLGLPWYARNWVIGGSPIYPSSLSVAGQTLARGAFNHAAMNNSVFHVNGIGLWPVVAAHAFGAPAFAFWAPCAAIGAAVFMARRRWWPGMLVVMLPLLMVPLEWLGVPDNADARFLLPAVAVAMVPLALPFTTNRVWNACVRTAYLAGAPWLLVGTRARIIRPVPWFMTDWLSLDGLIPREALALFAIAVAVSACAAYLAGKTRARAGLLACTCIAGCVIAVIGLRTLCAPADCGGLAISPTYIRTQVVDAWQWERANIHGATIAYAGNNLPYPLFGDQLSNRVRYVNIDRHTDWQFHDYARARRGSIRTDASAMLAVPSGQLMPRMPGQDASRPRFERWDGDRDAWIQNLRSAGATHLFVSALSAYEIDYMWHNADEFPIEEDWARSDRMRFALLYENAQARIYSIAQP